MVQRDISQNGNLEKLAQRANSWPQKRKKQDWKFSNCLIKRESSGLDQITTQSYQRVKSPLLTTVQALNQRSTDTMIAFMNQYWWENNNKATKSAYLTCPTCPNYNPKKPIYMALRHFKSPNGPLKFQQTNFIECYWVQSCSSLCMTGQCIRDKVLRQGIWLYAESWQTEKMAD